jgi:hypothetical protein
MEPMETPLLKMPMPRARWRGGNHSAIAFAAPGQFPASPMPSTNLRALRLAKPRANACPMAAADHIKMEKVNPRRVPTRS